MRKLILFLIVGVFLISLVSSAESSLGIFKQNECIRLIQTCADCTYNNITSIVAPNSSTILSGQLAMTKVGTEYNYTFCSTSALGTYTVNGHGNVNGIKEIWSYDFEITPSGTSLDSGQSINLLGSLIVIIILGVAFFFIAYKSENTVAKISFYVFSVIVFIMVVLYTVVIMQQTLFGFENIITGIETFWFVVKMGITIGILALGIVIFLVMLKAWKIKRGYIDVD